jgi:hypothetical protein
MADTPETPEAPKRTSIRKALFYLITLPVWACLWLINAGIGFAKDRKKKTTTTAESPEFEASQLYTEVEKSTLEVSAKLANEEWFRILFSIIYLPSLIMAGVLVGELWLAWKWDFSTILINAMLTSLMGLFLTTLVLWITFFEAPEGNVKAVKLIFNKPVNGPTIGPGGWLIVPPFVQLIQWIVVRLDYKLPPELENQAGSFETYVGTAVGLDITYKVTIGNCEGEGEDRKRKGWPTITEGGHEREAQGEELFDEELKDKLQSLEREKGTITTAGTKSRITLNLPNKRNKTGYTFAEILARYNTSKKSKVEITLADGTTREDEDRRGLINDLRRRLTFIEEQRLKIEKKVTDANYVAVHSIVIRNGEEPSYKTQYNKFKVRIEGFVLKVVFAMSKNREAYNLWVERQGLGKEQLEAQGVFLRHQVVSDLKDVIKTYTAVGAIDDADEVFYKVHAKLSRRCEEFDIRAELTITDISYPPRKEEQILNNEIAEDKTAQIEHEAEQIRITGNAKAEVIRMEMEAQIDTMAPQIEEGDSKAEREAKAKKRQEAGRAVYYTKEDAAGGRYIRNVIRRTTDDE